jgi:predicted nicotinamide N-methyase
MEREIESFGRIIRIKQVKKDFSGELGGTVWDAAIVLIKYFENLEEFPIGFFKGKKIIELGSGTGLVGIVIGLLGGNIIITDRKPLLNLMKENIQKNFIEKKVKVEELEWGKDCSYLNPPFDIILASDVMSYCYYESQESFFQTLKDLSNKNTRIILSYEKRDMKDLEFFKKLSKDFIYQKVSNNKLDKFWQSEDIGIFEVQKK